MSTVYHWKHGALYESEDSPSDYLMSLKACMEFMHAGYKAQGYDVVDVDAGVNGILSAGLDFVIGDTWVAGFSIEEPWFLRDVLCMEEFYGPRWLGDEVDLQDFLAGANTYGFLKGATRLEFGTRANPRHKALARLCEKHGAAVAAVTLTKVISNGIG